MPAPSSRQATERGRGRGGDGGSAAPLIIGFAVVLMLTIGMVVDASAAFLHRQSLVSLADGAALAAADAGAEGAEVYLGGLSDEPLALTREKALVGVRAYLTQIGAAGDFPDLAFDVTVRDAVVSVRISAPVELPFPVPGAPQRPRVSATSSASVEPQ